MGKVIDRKTLKSSTNTQYGSDKSARSGYFSSTSTGNFGDRAPKKEMVPKFDERAEKKGKEKKELHEKTSTKV